MAVCRTCNQEMGAADSCVGGIDLSVVTGTLRCHDCNVAPGGTHHPGCDTERCSVCHMQAISCSRHDARDRGEEVELHDPTKERWAGEWPGRATARKLGLWCRCVWSDGRPVLPGEFEAFLDERPSPGQFWIPCSETDAGATEDLNRAAVIEVQLAGGLTLAELGFPDPPEA